MSDRPRVVVSTNPVKESVRIDRDGNEIDPRTKQIIGRVEETTKPPESPTTNQPEQS